MKNDIKQLGVVCEKTFSEKITDEELFDISDKLKRLSLIAYRQMLRERAQSTELDESVKIEILTQPNSH